MQEYERPEYHFRFESPLLHTHEHLPAFLEPGDLYVANEDAIGFIEKSLYLAPGDGVSLEVALPFDITDLPKNSILGLSLRSNLAQSGLDIESMTYKWSQPQQSEGLRLKLKLKNNSLNSFYLPKSDAEERTSLSIGRVYFRHPVPLQGEALGTVADRITREDTVITVGQDTRLSPYQYVKLPVIHSLRQVTVPAPINLNELPRGSRREQLHSVLGVSRDDSVPDSAVCLDTPITLVESENIALPDDVYLFVIGAVDSNELDDSSDDVIFHTASTLLYDSLPDDNRNPHTRIGEIYQNGNALPTDVTKLSLACFAYTYHPF